MIPNIIHQTWKNEDLPPDWASYAESWKTYHPAWEYRFWTDADNRALIAGSYPELLAVYDAYPYAILRADLARYCMLHRFGGVYVDMDIECLQPIESLTKGRDCFAVLEPDAQAAHLGMSALVSNAFLGASPGHPFFAAVLKAIARETRQAVSHRDVLDLTGPLCITRVLRSTEGLDVDLLDSRVAFPLTALTPELRCLQLKEPGHEAAREKLIAEGSYALHYWANTWVGTLAGELVNTDPENIDGFEFVRGLDSPGNDITNIGRDIRVAAERCLAMPEAVAFNTDGFAKRLLLPRSQWQPMGNGAANEGLYLKKKAGRRRSLYEAVVAGPLSKLLLLSRPAHRQ